MASKQPNWPHTKQSCLEWQGLLDKDGYGRVKVGDKAVRVHRAFYEVWFDTTLTKDEVLLHACDNPKCFNPSHLRKGTQAENVADMDAKGRRVSASSLVTHCPQGHPYTNENTIMYADGKRRCKTCRTLQRRKK